MISIQPLFSLNWQEIDSVLIRKRISIQPLFSLNDLLGWYEYEISISIQPLFSLNNMNVSLEHQESDFNTTSVFIKLGEITIKNIAKSDFNTTSVFIKR